MRRRPLRGAMRRLRSWRREGWLVRRSFTSCQFLVLSCQERRERATARARAIGQSFALRASLLPSAERCWIWVEQMRPEVEALGYLEARAEADSRGSDRKKCKG